MSPGARLHPPRKGARVETTGEGRTARWGRTVGTVTSARRGRVFVRWDRCSFEDEMRPEEVRPAT